MERLPTTTSFDELQIWAHELRDCLGVAHVVYHTVNIKGEQVGAFTYDIAWVRRYIERDYAQYDPTVLGATRRFTPMDWKTLDWSSPQARQLMREAAAAGVGNQGWSVPIWGPAGEYAVFAVNHNASDDGLGCVHRQAGEGHPADLPPRAPAGEADPEQRDRRADGRPVAAREGGADPAQPGQSRAAVADTLHISENTLRAYIDSARHKLGAMNVTHAVALALARGIIVPHGALPKY